MSGKFARTGTGMRRLSLLRSQLQRFRDFSGSPACRCSAASGG